MTVRFYSSVATPKTLSTSITNATTLIQISDTVGLPTQYPFTLSLDYETPVEELVDVTNVAGNMITVTRGVDGTTATSHTAGAVVRHVSSARDFTDSRNHENSSTNVHGTAVGSAVVGTTDTQSLSNKTISGGSFTGTSAFTGDITHTGEYRGVRPLVTSEQFETRVTGDTFSRWDMTADGTQSWGSGSGAPDVSIARVNPGELYVDGRLSVANSDASPSVTHFNLEPLSPDPTSTIMNVHSGIQSVMKIDAAGATTVAPTAGSNVNALTVNQASGSTGHIAEYQVNGTPLAVMDNTGTFTTYQGNAPIAYTPVMTGQGSATFITTAGWYYRIGKLIQVFAYFVTNAAGSGTSTVTVSLPSVPFRDGAGANTTRQAINAHVAGVAAGTNSSISGSFTGIMLAGSSGAQIDNLFGPTEILLQGNNLSSNTIITIEGWYREA